MKIWYPIQYDESKNGSTIMYIATCQVNLKIFKNILFRNILTTKWSALTDTLCETGIINNTFTRRFKAIQIAQQYVNNLRCYYDANLAKCYYMVPDSIKCVGTDLQLNKVIKLIEYGDKNVPPINWIRHSYLIFKDMILGGVN